MQSNPSLIVNDDRLKAVCSICKKWKRTIRLDYDDLTIWICQSCHKKFKGKAVMLGEDRYA